MVELGVNIDHIATVRQQRLPIRQAGLPAGRQAAGSFPDPIYAALTAEAHGADGIVAHLREDRRHIQDRDVKVLRQVVRTRLSLEMAATEEMEAIALDLVPHRVCLVPEKRQELTTEGGLDVIAHRSRFQKMIHRLSAKKIFVSVFIHPDIDQIKCARSLGADAVEFHTGSYADAPAGLARDKELAMLRKGVEKAQQLKLHVHAGHGLDYKNVIPVARLPGMEELNIGYAIVARALFVGWGPAVKEMKDLLDKNSSPFKGEVR